MECRKIKNIDMAVNAVTRISYNAHGPVAKLALTYTNCMLTGIYIRIGDIIFQYDQTRPTPKETPKYTGPENDYIRKYSYLLDVSSDVRYWNLLKDHISDGKQSLLLSKPLPEIQKIVKLVKDVVDADGSFCGISQIIRLAYDYSDIIADIQEAV